MRSPAGYQYSTPVRIHCGKCKTLLSGEFISDDTNIKAYYIPKNCKCVESNKYDFYGEASGEIICNKIERIDGDIKVTPIPKPSPVFSFIYSMSEEDRSRFIDYACYASNLSNDWDNARIKYDLFLNGEFVLLKEKFSDIAYKVGYDLTNEREIFRYIYFSVLFDCTGVFKRKEIKRTLNDINYKITHLNKSSLTEYLTYLESENRLDYLQNKLFGLVSAYFNVVRFLIPAIGYTYYNNPSQVDKETQGLSTCSFLDISKFYLDTFEVLAECCEIVVGLDNIDNRANYNTFTNSLDMLKFRQQKKGNRIKFLSANEFFSKTFNLNSNSNDLRNAIGHNNYKYDGIMQKIEYTANQNDGEEKSVYLLDVATECVNLMKCTCIILFYLYELKRFDLILKGYPLDIHSLFYSSVNSPNLCPCGSGKKYRNCCKKNVSQKTNVNIIDYPQKSNFSLTTNMIRKK